MYRQNVPSCPLLNTVLLLKYNLNFNGRLQIPGLVKWDLWWTKWLWGGFSPSTSVSPANLLHHHNHLGQVQEANQWPPCRVDPVRLHPPLSELIKQITTRLPTLCVSYDLIHAVK
jgi:hypothetical protein